MGNTTLLTQIITITPADAEEMLSRNTRNRNVKQALVNRFALSMARGEWDLNGEAIKVADTGLVLDGQHRLHACVKSGAPFTSLVITGLPEATQYTMDTGKSRTLADMMKLQGEKDYVRLSALTTAVLRARKWGIRVAIAPGATSYVLTIKEQLDFLEDNPWLRDLCAASTDYLRLGITARVAGLMLHVLGEIDREDAEFFFERLKDGADLENGSPILALREWLRNNRTEKNSGSKQVVRGMDAQVYMTAVIIKAWNAYRAGRQIKVLAYRIGGAKPEAFPEPM